MTRYIHTMVLLSNNVTVDTDTNVDGSPKRYAEQKTPNTEELMLYMIPFIGNANIIHSERK